MIYLEVCHFYSETKAHCLTFGGWIHIPDFLMPILQSLEKIDRTLFELINNDATAPFLDPVMSLLRNPDTWIPLYVFMAFWSVIRLKKVTWLFVLCTLITFAFTDSVTAFLFKPLFERIRPCAEPALAGIVRVLDGCGGKYSFPS